MSPVLFSPCQVSGRYMMCANKSSLIFCTNVSAPLAFIVRKIYRQMAATNPTPSTAAASMTGLFRRPSTPPPAETMPLTPAGKTAGFVPMTESTVKEIIFGLTMSSSDTSPANSMPRTKYRFEPERKCSIKLILDGYFCLVCTFSSESYIVSL